MPVTLEEARRGAQDDLDTAVIDEFRKSSEVLDALIYDDVVNPAGGGATLTYGYRRLATQASAAFRQLNTEYVPGEVVTEQVYVNLAPLGGSFQIDRVIAEVGNPSQIALQMSQKIKSTRALFNDAIINGDTLEAEYQYGFDGLDKALSGSSTEVGVGQTIDWSDLDATASTGHKAIDKLDEFLSVLDGAPTLLIGNRQVLAKVRGIARRTGQYVREPLADLTDNRGRPIFREFYGGVTLVDAGEKAGSSAQVIPVVTRDLDNSVWTLTYGGTVSGGDFDLTVTVGGDAQTASNIPWNATNADIKAALEGLSNVGAGDVTVTGTTTKTVTFAGTLRFVVVTLAAEDADITGGGTIVAATSGTATGVTGLSDLYAVRIGLDGFHAVTVAGRQVVRSWLPDFSTAGAVKTGEVELGPVGIALKATKAAAVLRNIKTS
jgi:hypothetical protein